MAKVGVTLAVLAALALPARAQVVKVDSALFAQVDYYAQDSIEHVACLYGRTLGDTVELSSFYMPGQAPIGTHNVTADSSHCKAALAMWHNHPVPKDSTKLSYLYYSLTDEHTFVRTTNSPYAIVAVPGIWCVWTRQQVQDGYVRNLTPLPAIWSQCLHN